MSHSKVLICYLKQVIENISTHCNVKIKLSNFLSKNLFARYFQYFLPSLALSDVKKTNCSKSTLKSHQYRIKIACEFFKNSRFFAYFFSFHFFTPQRDEQIFSAILALTDVNKTNGSKSTLNHRYSDCLRVLQKQSGFRLILFSFFSRRGAMKNRQ